MTAAPFFHVGFLVHDLDEAMARFSEALDLSWTGRTTTRSRFWEPDRGIVTLELDVAYSVEGPPHIELLEAKDDGIYAATREEGFHHIGAWGADLEATARRLAERGLERVGTQYDGEDQPILSYFDPTALHGVMLEVIDDRRRPMMEAWVRGSRFVD